MIELIKDWIINIVVAIFFVAFIEILLPTSNMKRYINMILGLLIIIVLINPIIKFMSSDINIEREVFLNMKNHNTFGADNDSKYVEAQNSQIAEIYIKKLEKEIVDVVRKEEKYNVLKVNIVIEENSQSQDFGKINGIELYLTASNIGSESTTGIKVDEMENISIGSNGKNISEDAMVSSPDTKQIIETISSLYEVPKDKIIIKIKT